MITGGDLRQSRLDVGYKTFTISPWGYHPAFIYQGYISASFKKVSFHFFPVYYYSGLNY